MSRRAPAAVPAGVGILFRQIARTLAQEIEQGTYPVGSLLPTEHELARRYGVSRQTMRRALAELRAEGLIASRQGFGSQVLRRGGRRRYVEAYSSIDDLVRYAQGRPIIAHAVDDVVADAAQAENLKCREGQSFIHIVGLRYGTEGTAAPPVAHVEVFVESRFASIRERAFSLTTSIVTEIEHGYGVRAERIVQEISAALVPKEIAHRLQVEPGSPALGIRRWYYGPDERVFEASIGLYPLGRFTYRNELVRRPPS